jgi:hypothetical protein
MLHMREVVAAELLLALLPEVVFKQLLLVE